MKKTLVIGVVILILLGGLTYKMLKLGQIECSMCLVMKGRKQCQTAFGPDESQALEEAHRSLCAQMTSGVTEIVACNRLNREEISCGPAGKTLKD